jgi:hypothetical protein
MEKKYLTQNKKIDTLVKKEQEKTNGKIYHKILVTINMYFTHE